ncbi:MAG TPA: hypothetical protein VEV81_08935, partial [Pyrinomonadaceae bacterium]|nr:hypothetical protein [Pyrinomonadaceae bacterium]
MLSREKAGLAVVQPGSSQPSSEPHLRALPGRTDWPLGQLRLIDSKTVERVAEARLPTEVGEFRIAGYRSRTSGEEFVVLFKGELKPERPTLVRIHSQCLTGDVFGSVKCDCGRQLRAAMEMIEREGCGAIVYQ